MPDRPTGRAPLAAVLSLALCVLLAAPAAADTFVPTRFDDPAPPNKCKPDDCSLREAIRASNNHNGRDEVVLGEGTYELEILPTDSPLNADGQLFVSGPATIRGLGPGETSIDANGIDRVLAAGGKSTLEGLTVKGGDAGANPFHSSEGGGILGIGDKLALRNVLIKQNAAQLGGGLEFRGIKLTIRDSTIAKNNAGEGGGIDLRAAFAQPLMEIRSSTISGNSAGKGGGILADGFAPSTQIPPILDIDNSTVAGNMASAEAGGIMADNSATVTLDNSTVAYNQANSDNVGVGDGGGVYQHSGAVFQLADSLIAENTVGQGGSGPQCAGTFTPFGSNVSTGGPGECPAINYTDLGIGSLADNGGPTKTVALEAGSPALGAVNDCPARDQRGKQRPETGCDYGAYERKGP